MVRSSANLPKEVSSQELRSCFEFKSRGRKRVILESSGGFGLKVKVQVNFLFSKAQCGSGSSITLPKGVSRQESSSSVEFELKGWKVNFKEENESTSSRVGIRVEG